MKTIISVLRALILAVLVEASLVITAPAPEVQVPDPGLDAAIRAALQKPAGH